MDLGDLNVVQREAVTAVNGPSLIIAGAGSGKTKVLTSKIAYLLDNGVKPGEILALTFTNKASKEMKERIAQMVGREKAVRLWMGTFHSIFIRFLREYAELIGFPRAFTVYDASDTRSLLRSCIKEMELDDKMYKANEAQSRISLAKNNLITATAYMNNAGLIKRDMEQKKGRMCEIYKMYAGKCYKSGAMDFDDILLFMNILLRDHPQVVDALQSKFKYILVDEYQDTNYAQYLIVKKIAGMHRNITVVGDDSQSIYAFRGAKIENILNFKKDYPDAKEFRLEQNYRSTKTIVDAANSLISKNSQRLEKECFSTASQGDKIEVLRAFTEQEEAFMIATSIVDRIYRAKASYDHFAVLYRTNAQSRSIEEALRKKNLPYKIYAGHSFYERKEVKDMLAYLRLIVNTKDDEAFRRVVNVPARGIGLTTIGALSQAATENSMSIWDTVCNADLTKYGLKSAAINKLYEFVKMIISLQETNKEMNAFEIAGQTAVISGLRRSMEEDTSLEGRSHLENLEELINSIKEFVEDREVEIEDLAEMGVTDHDIDLSLSSYLENVSLISDLDGKDKEEDQNKVSLMTVHSSKGLEFPYVYIAGMEESLFPSQMSSSTPDEIEEERRLFYVALTRAKTAISVSYSKSRFRWGQHVNYPPSRFLKEIDSRYLDKSIVEDIPKTRTIEPDSQSSGYSRPARQTPLKAPTPGFVADPVESFKVGMRIEHDRFGFGEIMSLEGVGNNMKAIIEFEEGGKKTLLMKFAKLRAVL